MKKITTANDILKKMGDVFLEKKKAGESMEGSTFLLPNHLFKKVCKAVGSEDQKVKFMGLPVLSDKRKDIVITGALVKNDEASLNIEQHAMEVIREQHEKLTEMLREALEKEGHVFKSDAMMFKFIRANVKIETKREGRIRTDHVMLGDKELISYEVDDRNDQDEE